MKIGIPTFGSDDGRSGIGRYLVHVLQEMSQFPICPDLELITHPGQYDVFLPPQSRVSTRSIGRGLRHPVLNIAWHQLALPRWSRRRKYDLVFLPAANRRLPATLKCTTVGAVHDLSSFHVENKYDPARMFYIKKILPRMIQRLTHVITMSESSKRDIVQHAHVQEDRITVIPLGVDHARYYPGDDEKIRCQIQQLHGIRQPYIVYVSRLEHPGKNHVRLIQAFELLKERTKCPHQLVLAGGDWTRAQEIHAAAAKSRFAQEIVFTGFVASEHLRNLYNDAEMMVFPSLYEGFGLPLLEAMACGTPVACSNLSSLPEVAAEAACLFNPYSIDEIAYSMESIIESPSARKHFSDAGRQRSLQYDWRTTASRTMDVLLKTAEAHA